jgi:hypothetical protein
MAGERPGDPPMSETAEAYAVKFYDGMGALVGTYSSSSRELHLHGR